MTVLVAYDGSLPAQQAVEHAVREHADEELILLRVIEASGGSLEAGIDLFKEELKKARDETVTELDEELTDLINEEDIEFQIEVTVGQPARKIVEFAEANGVDHIIIGSHGRKGVSRILLGSVAELVVRRAHCTVTVVR